MGAPRFHMTDRRRQLLAKVHVLAKQAQLDDDAYRDLMARETGRRSAAELGDAELADLCETLKGMAPRSAVKLDGPYAGKIKALWLSAWHLGIARSNADGAALAFIKRQTGIDHGRFLINARDANKAIEGLKAWIERDGGVVWTSWPLNPRRAVAEAQVRALEKLDDIRAFSERDTFLEDYVCRVTGKNRGIAHLDDADWDKAIAALGARLRRVKALDTMKRAART